MALCGPSQSEELVQADQQNLAQTMSSDFQKRFGEQSQLLQNLNTSLTPIIAAGPSQQGFSAEELAAKNTAAINNAAAANRNAQQSASTILAGQGNGGGSGIVSGIQQQIKGSIASEEAGNLANQENAITAENYATGRDNYRSALAGANALSGQYNPMAYGSGAESGFGASFGEAGKIQSEKNAKVAAIGGLVASAIPFVGQGIAGGLGNLGGKGSGSSFGENIGNFFSGGLGALAG